MLTWRHLRFLTLAILIMLPVLVGFYQERLLSYSLIMVMAALSLYIVTGLAGQASMGQSAFMAIGGYVSALLATRYGIPFWWALPIAAISSAIAGFIVGLPSLRTRGLFLSFTTLMFTLITWTTLVNAEALTGGMYGISAIHRPAFFDSPTAYYYLLLLIMVVIVLLAYRLTISRLGYLMIAVRDNENAASALGIRPSHVKLLAFVISAFFAGISGCLYAYLLGHISPEMFPPGLSLELLMMVAIGGVRRIEGAILGAFLLTTLPEMLRFARSFWNVLFGIILIVTVIAMPGGLASLVDKLITKQARNSGKALQNEPAARPNETSLSVVSDMWMTDSPVVNQVCPEPLLEVAGLTRYFGGVAAVDQLSFIVPKGTIFGIIGPNGAGKSVLINLISGFTQAQSGVVTFRDRPISGCTPAEIASVGLGRTFQEPHVFGSLTALDHILLAGQQKSIWPHFRDYLWMGGTVRASRPERAWAESVLSSVGLISVAHKPADSLSYGQKKLLSLATVMANDVSCILLDEPAAGVSVALTEQMVALIQGYNKYKDVTFIIVEHRMQMIVALCEQVLVLNQGKMLTVDTPQAVQVHPKVIDLYFGAQNHE